MSESVTKLERWSKTENEVRRPFPGSSSLETPKHQNRAWANRQELVNCFSKEGETTRRPGDGTA